jgi:hypothetical protein
MARETLSRHSPLKSGSGRLRRRTDQPAEKEENEIDQKKENSKQGRQPPESPLQSGIGGAVGQVRRNTNDLRADDVMKLPAEPVGRSIESNHFRRSLVRRTVAGEATVTVDPDRSRVKERGP